MRSVEYIPNTRGQEMMSVLQDQPAPSISSTWDSDSAFFQEFSCHSHEPTRTGLVLDEQRDGHLCLGRRIQIFGYSDSGFSEILERRLFLLECKLVTASAACPADPGSLPRTSISFVAVI